MALLGTYGGADDVRVQANRLGAPQAGGIYGGVQDLTEVYVTNTEWAIEQTDATSFKITGATGDAASWNTTGGTLDYVGLEETGGIAYHWYLNGVDKSVSTDEPFLSPTTAFSTVAPGDVIHVVRYGVSSVTGELILSSCAPLIVVAV